MKKPATCIFCKREHDDESVEHIVPRTLGNLHYILPKGTVCQRCNQRFSHMENRVLSSTLFLEERRRFGLLRRNHGAEGQPLEELDLVKFVGKVAYEALYKSRRRLWTRTDFAALLSLLMRGVDNPLFLDRPREGEMRFRPVPGWIERFRLRNNHIHLAYAEDGEKLYFRFRFGKLARTVRIC